MDAIEGRIAKGGNMKLIWSPAVTLDGNIAKADGLFLIV
jgi:hypothetical protein